MSAAGLDTPTLLSSSPMDLVALAVRMCPQGAAFPLGLLEPDLGGGVGAP